MSENSAIEWTDHTFNPWIGCSKVHEGCTHCYAETLMDQRYGKVKWGPQGTRVKTSEANWRQPLKWNHDAQAAGVRAKVFCASLADVFEDWQGAIHDGAKRRLWRSRRAEGISDYIQESPEWSFANCRLATVDDLRRDLFSLIDATPHLDWLLLTKRPDNIRRMWPGVSVNSQQQAEDRNERGELYRRNVWIGTSISLQEHADRQIPELLKYRDLSPVLFLSIEPLLGPIDLQEYLMGYHDDDVAGGRYVQLPHTTPYIHQPKKIDWVIVGGESGHNARPMHPQWVREIRDQCRAAGVPFFFKQWGEWKPIATLSGRQEVPFADFDTTGVMNHFGFMKVGKKAAGRLLDGEEYSEFPTPAECAPTSG